MRRMCTSIGISTSGARPLRKRVHYCGLIDGVWALRLGFEKPGMARLEGHGQNCPQFTGERKCCGHYFQRRFWSARSPAVRWRRRRMPAVRCLQSPRAFPPRLMRQSPGPRTRIEHRRTRGGGNKMPKHSSVDANLDQFMETMARVLEISKALTNMSTYVELL